jgi:hypothetical protein
MTCSTPLKILVACFAVAALMATTMSGSESAGLKGSRKLQSLGLPPSDSVDSIFANSFGIAAALNPPPFVPAEVNSITANSFGIAAAFNPPPVVPVAVNSIFANSFGIAATLNPPPFVPAEVNSITANSFGIAATLNPPPVLPVGPATTATNTVLSQAAEILKGFNP